jgi:hypothetical protein
MSKGAKRWGAAGVGLLLVGAAIALLLSRRTPAPKSGAVEDLPEDVSQRWRGFAAAMPSAPSDDVPPTPLPAGAPPNEGAGWLAPQITREQMDLAMEGWRQAILEKNADNVMALDRVFLLLPGRYGPQLERLAQEDPEERIRAFSTRELGKMKNVALTGLYQRLLGDKSPYVRQNAAWALGELISLPQGKAAAERATAELRQAQDSDPSPDVRTAATLTLKKLQ